MIAAYIGALSLVTWGYLLLGRGGFWLMRTEPEPAAPQSSSRRIAVIIPARDEAPAIRQSVQSLLRQTYAGPTHIFLVDDHSSDGTAEIARQAAHEAGASDRLTVVEAQTLPAGWTGKLWSVSQGLQASASFHAEYYLFTDADIIHEPANLESLVRRAESDNLDLVSYMVRLRC